MSAKTLSPVVPLPAPAAPPATARDSGEPADSPRTAEVMRYGLLGLPLAFVALPLIVQWPAYAGVHWGLPLATLGLLLLVVRVADALVDPWIGQRADGWFAAGGQRPWGALAAAALVLILGFAGLFFAPDSLRATGSTQTALLAWSAAALVVTYLGYSVASVVHQAWAARLGGDAVARSRWVGTREGFALLGVLSASVLPTLAGWAVTGLVLALLLVLGLAALWGLGSAAPQARASTMSAAALPAKPGLGSLAASPWRNMPFRWLLVVYTLNGLAASIPASLVLFFVRDRVQAPAVYEAIFLAAYFGAAALAVPLWIRSVACRGLVRSWMLGMGLAVLAFAGAVTVGAGQTGLFLAICIASGLALGADLVAPAALLAGVIQRSGIQGQAEGRWFGWWSMATKLTLALAAGVALPLVQALGYVPGARDTTALQALAIVYAVVPCVIKALSLLLLWLRRRDWAEDESNTANG